MIFRYLSGVEGYAFTGSSGISEPNWVSWMVMILESEKNENDGCTFLFHHQMNHLVTLNQSLFMR